jgi:hypothetical protein
MRIHACARICACLRRQFFTKGNFPTEEGGQARCKTRIRRILSRIGSLLQCARYQISQSSKVSSEEVPLRSRWEAFRLGFARFRKERGDRVRCKKAAC